MNIAEALASRRSIRAFSNRPVPIETVRRILDQARLTPSGCNYQPWEAIVLTGKSLERLQSRLQASEPDNPLEYDYSAPSASEKYHSRLQAVGARMYAAAAIERSDKDRRANFTRDNLVSFGAPVLMLCHFPKFMKEA